MIKNILKITLITACIHFDNNLIAGNKQSSMVTDFTETLENLSPKEISILVIGAVISNVAGEYVRSNLDRQFGGTQSAVQSDVQSDEEPLCSFIFDKDAFGKLSEDGSHDYRSDEELESEQDLRPDIYELAQSMNCDDESNVHLCKLLSLEDIKNK